jgi:2'-hydroxyisoflavone reductase
MRLLVLGGTKFVGRTLVEEAVRRSHEITIFHRGEAEPEGFPAVEHVHGDRHSDLGLLSGRSWDAAVDTHAYFPGEVRDAAAALGGNVAHYTLVSTLSVNPDDVPASANEESPLREPLFSDDVELSGETYGALKVACEIEAARAFGGRCLTIRPGYIVGPNDPTERFIRYVRRAAGGGEMLAPGPPGSPLQMIDVRDLAAFVLDRIEARDDDVYGVVGPGEANTMLSTLETIRVVGGADTSFVWAEERFLDELGDDVSRWFPMWHPSFAIHTYDASKAVRAGLRHRPLSETVADTLAWDRERGTPKIPSPLSHEKERELIAAWRASEAAG